MDNQVVISRVVGLTDDALTRPGFIKLVSSMWHEAKLKQPELAGYHLHEIGLQPRLGHVKVNLYFRR